MTGLKHDKDSATMRSRMKDSKRKSKKWTEKIKSDELLLLDS